MRLRTAQFESPCGPQSKTHLLILQRYNIFIKRQVPIRNALFQILAFLFNVTQRDIHTKKSALESYDSGAEIFGHSNESPCKDLFT